MGQNYISVTGASNSGDVTHLIDIFKGHNLDGGSVIVPAIGFQVMRANLQGSDKYSMRNPPIGEIKHLLAQAKGNVFPIIHYNSSTNQGYASEIQQLIETTNPEGICKRIQVNNRGQLKPAEELVHVKEVFPWLEICLQVPPNKLDVSRDQVVSTLTAYSRVIHSIIIDDSRGTGTELPVYDVIQFYNQVKDALPDLGIVIAGGLDGRVVREDVSKITEAVGKGFSVDTEGKLRTKTSPDAKRGDDVLNYKKAEEYIGASVELFL